jgi:hypothetical protein
LSRAARVAAVACLAAGVAVLPWFARPERGDADRAEDDSLRGEATVRVVEGAGTRAEVVVR